MDNVTKSWIISLKEQYKAYMLLSRGLGMEHYKERAIACYLKAVELKYKSEQKTNIIDMRKYVA